MMPYNTFYNPYQSYQSPYLPQTQPQQTAASNNGLNWVQGETGAKSYMVAPGNTVLLMDSEGQRFYLKSSDASGMPLPLRVFEYAEITASAGLDRKTDDSTAYATKAELAAFKDEINAILQNASKRTVKGDAKPAVQRTEQE